jgi:hypothetical protein
MIDFGYLDPEQHRTGKMRVATAVIGGTALLGAGTSLFAGNEQANATRDATAQANAIQQQQYNQTRSDEAPYRNAGTTALNTIGQDMSTGTGFAKPFDMNSFYSDPGYQFQLNQGTQAIGRSAAAQGRLLSGAAGKAIAGYTTGLANTTYGDAYNRYLQSSNQQYNQLAGVAGMGLNATGMTAQAGQNSANNQSATTYNGITQAANATASGYVGAANALSAGASGIANYGLQSQALNSLNGSGYGSNPYQTLYNAQHAGIGGIQPSNIWAGGQI